MTKPSMSPPISLLPRTKVCLNVNVMPSNVTFHDFCSAHIGGWYNVTGIPNDLDPVKIYRKTIRVFIIVTDVHPRDCDSWPWPCHDLDPVVTLTLNRNRMITLTHSQSTTTTTTGHDPMSSSTLNALTRSKVKGQTCDLDPVITLTPFWPWS